MDEGRTSVILFTPNIAKDKKQPYFLEFQKVANSLFAESESEEDRLLFVASGISWGI